MLKGRSFCEDFGEIRWRRGNIFKKNENIFNLM
jgi:hypothetical protein